MHDFYPCFEAEFFVLSAEQCTSQVHIHELKALHWRHAPKHDGLAKWNLKLQAASDLGYSNRIYNLPGPESN